MAYRIPIAIDRSVQWHLLWSGQQLQSERMSYLSLLLRSTIISIQYNLQADYALVQGTLPKRHKIRQNDGRNRKQSTGADSLHS